MSNIRKVTRYVLVHDFLDYNSKVGAIRKLNIPKQFTQYRSIKNKIKVRKSKKNPKGFIYESKTVVEIYLCSQKSAIKVWGVLNNV